MVCSTTAATTYQAAAIPVVYSAWEVFVTIFALLGITLSVADTVEARLEAARELEDKFVGWQVLKNEGQGDNDGDGEDDLYAAFDITDYLDGDNLVIPDEDLEEFMDFYQDNMAPPVSVYPIDNTDFKNMNYQEFTDWFNSYFPSYSSWSGANTFRSTMYDKLAAYDYSGVVFAYNGFDPFRICFDALNTYSQNRSLSSYYFGYQETSNGGVCQFKRLYLSSNGTSLVGSSFLSEKNIALLGNSKGFHNDWCFLKSRVRRLFSP